MTRPNRTTGRDIYTVIILTLASVLLLASLVLLMMAFVPTECVIRMVTR